MFNFPRIPVEELNTREILEPGKYPFRIVEANEKISSTGNPMIELKLEVSSNDGNTVTVYDYLVSTEKMAWKCHHLCCAIGHEELYINGKVNVKSLEGTGGYLSLKIANHPEHGKSNKVKDYITSNENVEPVSNYESPPVFDDGIDF